MSEVKSISPEELYELFENGEKPYLIDVRTKEEYDEVRAAIISKHVPLDRFDPDDLELDPGADVYIICRSGRRSYDAAAQCVAFGFENVFNVEGGTLEWQAQNLPVKGDAID